MRLTALIALLAAVLACGSPRGLGAPDASVPDSGTTPDGGATPDGGSPGDGGTTDAGPATLNILFVGDSYTYVNDLPGMLSQIAATAGVPPLISTAQAVQGGATLGVLWDAGFAIAQITDGGWTQVVVQGESGESIFDPVDFDAYALRFENLILDAGAQPVLFVTWARAAADSLYAPGPDNLFAYPAEMADTVTVAYAALAQAQPADVLVCVGQAFQQSLAQYPEIDLLQSDFTHPTVAGTYLAASTFYVALTGRPVPDQSAVPAGVSAQDAEHLRAIAQIGSNCANAQVKGAVLWEAQYLTDLVSPNNDGPPDAGLADAGFGDGGLVEFGTAGTAIPLSIELYNQSFFGTVGISDGMTLAPPFSWSNGIGFPGGSGPDFCGSSLGPATGTLYFASQTTCLLAVTYSGALTAPGLLTLDLTDDYVSSLRIPLYGTATSRASLTVSDQTGFFGCSDGTCGPAGSACDNGPFQLLVTNRGGAPTTALGVGTPLGTPVIWGPGPDAGAFPGGTGRGSMDGQTYAYCTSPTLAPAEQCLLTLSLENGGDAGITAVNLAYSDANGPVLPNANREVLWTHGRCLPP